MKRGEIYFIKRRNCFSTIGEAPKARPGVIVSADTLNANSEVVMVVYLTTHPQQSLPTHPQQSLPTHVCIHATGTPSTVLCERIDYVPTDMLGNSCGTCSEKEMAAIERGMLKALDMEWRADPTQHKAEPEDDAKEATKLSEGEKWLMQEVATLKAERDRYAKMLDLLLGGGEA